MAIYDDFLNNLGKLTSGRNVFGVKAPQYLTDLSNIATPQNNSPLNPISGLISKTQLEEAKKESLLNGLIAATGQFALAPRNKNAGSIAPYLLDAFVAGRGAAKSPYGDLAKSVGTKLELQKLRQQAQPDIYKKYLIAQNDPIKPFTGSFMDYETQLAQAKRPITKTTIGDNIYKKQFSDFYDKTMASMNPVELQANNQNLQTMQELLDEGVETGFGEETRLNINRSLNFLFPGQGFDRDIYSKEQFIASSQRIVLPLVKMLGVNPTDKDLDFVVKGSATFAKSPEGNRLMLKAIELDNSKKIEMNSLVSGWLNENYQLAQDNPLKARGQLDTFINKEIERMSIRDSEIIRDLRAQFAALDDNSNKPTNNKPGKVKLPPRFTIN